jgi:spermidine synthase
MVSELAAAAGRGDGHAAFACTAIHTRPNNSASVDASNHCWSLASSCARARRSTGRPATRSTQYQREGGSQAVSQPARCDQHEHDTGSEEDFCDPEGNGLGQGAAEVGVDEMGLFLERGEDDSIAEGDRANGGAQSERAEKRCQPHLTTKARSRATAKFRENLRPRAAGPGPSNGGPASVEPARFGRASPRLAVRSRLGSMVASEGRVWSRRRWLCASVAAFGLGLVRRREAFASGEKVLEEARSQYNHVVIGERGTVRTMYFVVDGVRYVESRTDLAHPRSLDLDYSRTMMAGFLVQPAPTRLLMVGLGGGQISNYLFDRFPGLEIDAVDIDPEVVRLARKYFAVPRSPRYRTHVADGRLFIERAPPSTRWDMVLLDAFRGLFVPYHLKTREFYRACLDRLTRTGVVTANLHNATRMYPHDRETLASVFPNRYGFVSERGNQTTFVASADRTRVGAYALRHNARALQGRFDFDLLGLAARYYLRRDWESGAEVLGDDFRPHDLEAAAERHNRTCIRGCAYINR